MHEGASPNPSFKNFLNMAVSEADLLRPKQLTNILKVLGDGGPDARGLSQDIEGVAGCVHQPPCGHGSEKAKPRPAP